MTDSCYLNGVKKVPVETPLWLYYKAAKVEVRKGKEVEMYLKGLPLGACLDTLNWYFEK